MLVTHLHTPTHHTRSTGLRIMTDGQAEIRVQPIKLVSYDGNTLPRRKSSCGCAPSSCADAQGKSWSRPTAAFFEHRAISEAPACASDERVSTWCQVSWLLSLPLPPLQRAAPGGGLFLTTIAGQIQTLVNPPPPPDEYVCVPPPG